MLNPPVLSNDEASATTGTATASTTSITLTSLDNSATVDLASLTPNGSFTTSTIEQSATFSLTTNNYTGYTLSIIASDDNGNLSTTVEPGDTPETIGSISTITSTEDFSASTSTAAENYNNKWGFRPSKYVDATNNIVVDNTGNNPVYLPSPTTTPTLLDKTSTANTTTANTYTLALGLRANQDTKAGTYTKTFNLVVTANPISYTINYNQNTTDTVTNMPTTQASDTSSTSITLTNTVPQRTGYTFKGWCSISTNDDSCSSTTYNSNGDGTNLIYGIDQTTTNTTTLYAMWGLDTFTCTKQYRLENADGTWGDYVTESTETVNYGGSCSYSKTVTDYRGASNAANGAQGSTSASDITTDTTLSLDFYRDTYTLTQGTGTPNTYRWGQTVTVDYTIRKSTTCISYSGSWTQSGTPGTFGSSRYNGTGTGHGSNYTYTYAKYSVPFTLGKGDVVITYTVSSANKPQTITLSRSGGTSGINIDGTNYTGSSVTLDCGSYNISGNYSSGYTFSSWAKDGSISVGNTGSNSTTMSVSGSGTLTLNSRALPSLAMQNVTFATCPTTPTEAYDIRDGTIYNIQKITTGDKTLCWMVSDLQLTRGTTLTSADSNVTSDYVLPNPGGGKYYLWNEATAGTANGTPTSTTTAAGDICPKAWRLPTDEDYNSLISIYNTREALKASPWNGNDGRVRGCMSSSSCSSTTLTSEGGYWTSKIARYSYKVGSNSSTYTTYIHYAMTFSDSSVEVSGIEQGRSGTNVYLRAGYKNSVRCVAKS